MKPRKTLSDVARRAKVSLSTVSRVASGAASIGDEVVERVRRAAVDLGVSLEPRGTAKMLAFVLSNRTVLHPFHARVLYGAQSYCRSQHCDLVFLSCDYTAELAPKDVHIPQIALRRNLVQAVVLAGTNYPNLLHELGRRRIPYAVYGNNVIGEWTPENHDVVFEDDTRGAYDATSYLISLGHREIGYLGDPSLAWFARTERGYRQALREASLAPRVSPMHVEERELGYLAAKSLLGRTPRPTALVAGTDATAEGACRAIRDLRLRIPGDISVCGLNDTESGLLHPPLSTVRCFPEETGSLLAEMALRRRADAAAPFAQVTIPTQIVKRESCAPPAR